MAFVTMSAVYESKIPMIIVKNDKDPVGLYEDVVEFLSGAGDDVEFIKLKGDTYDYDISSIIKK